MITLLNYCFGKWSLVALASGCSRISFFIKKSLSLLGRLDLMLSDTLRITSAFQWQKQELSVDLILDALMLHNTHRDYIAACLMAAAGPVFKKKKRCPHLSLRRKLRHRVTCSH